jgi:CheY-like chemotaxis protein
MKLLIVDDEPDIRDSLEEFFVHEGIEVETAGNGVEALERLRCNEPPSLVLLDLVMPLMTGGELYTAMQADPVLAKVPVIICTSDPSRAPSGLLIMKKPFNLDRLLLAVRQYA